MEIREVSQVGQEFATASTAQVREQKVQNEQRINKEQVNQEVKRQELSKDELIVMEDAAVNTLNSMSRELNFSFDKNTDRTIVSVVDSASGEVIRQIPSEEVLRIAEKLKGVKDPSQPLVGILLNNQV